ncbi:MAG TPA: sigma factor-like helix-turn-helix DNA-binding protein [Solirubrobacteraceae bacterium]
MQQATLAITRIPLDVLRDVTVALHARRLGDMRMIRAQDRQALYLKALGFRYHEIAALLGITYTAVNRRITEGRRRLRELEAAHDVVSGHSRTSRPR